MACLTPEAIRRLKQAFGSKEITIEKLNEMDSEQRRGYFASILGEPTAKWVNEVVESKLILKNQKQGLRNSRLLPLTLGLTLISAALLLVMTRQGGTYCHRFISII